MKIFSHIVKCVALAFALFLLDCSNPASHYQKNKRIQIEVKNPITLDAIWESGKDYLVHGEVVVEQNATLTIEKDVNVYLGLDSLGNKGKLHVKGRIIANGEDSTTAIVFQPESGDSQGDGNWGVEIVGNINSSFFKYCDFINCHYGISSVKNRIIINNCLFKACDLGVSISKCDSIFLSNSKFTSNNFGIKVELSRGLKDTCIIISGNNFVNCTSIALEVTNSSDALVMNNIYTNCAMGFECSFSSECKLIFNNFYGCSEGISYHDYSRGIVNHNIIDNCGIGVFISYGANPNINWNNFLFCKNYNISIYLNGIEMPINAENNWWGTNDELSITQTILDAYDFSNNISYGFVSFKPYEMKIIKNCGVRK